MIRVEHGDCLAVLPALAAEGVLVDSVVCDPPYHLTTGKKGGNGPASVNLNTPAGRARVNTGFMGKQWDGGDIAFRPETWAAVMAVMKPGAHLIAFNSTRTCHRMTTAIEDAGFEIRDTLCWHYGAGFPKSHNVSKTLKGFLPADVQCVCAPDCQQIVPGSQSGCRRGHGCDDAQPLDRSDIGQGDPPSQGDAQTRSPSRQCVDGPASTASHNRSSSFARPAMSGLLDQTCPPSEGFQCSGSVPSGKSESMSNEQSTAGHKIPRHKFYTSHSGGGSALSSSNNSGCDNENLPHCLTCGKLVVPEGLGTALKPATEFIVLARKPVAKGHTIAANVLAHGVGGLNIDACRIGLPEDDAEAYRRKYFDANGDAYKTKKSETFGQVQAGEFKPNFTGRWPANIIHDGSDEVVAAFPQTASGVPTAGDRNGGVYGDFASRALTNHGASQGSAARFFYSSKADADDRCGSKHPTVKPTDLMAYLCRLVTPPGGLVLDPFAGSGSTGMACLREGFDAILIERELEYYNDIKRRIAHVSGQDSPLFGVAA